MKQPTPTPEQIRFESLRAQISTFQKSKIQLQEQIKQLDAKIAEKEAKLTHWFCSICHKEIDQSEWDDFGGMCAKCENESYDAMISCAEEE